MSPNEQNIALAKACKVKATVPDYVNDLNAIHDAKETLGINDRNNLDIRVKWVGALRDVVSRRCPLNKLGTPVVSDLDILCASAEEHAEALLRTLKKWKTDKSI